MNSVRWRKIGETACALLSVAIAGGCLSVSDLTTVNDDAGMRGEQAQRDDAGPIRIPSWSTVETEEGRWYDPIAGLLYPQFVHDRSEPHGPRTACRSAIECVSPNGPDPGSTEQWGVCAADGYCLRRCEKFGACVEHVSARQITALVGDSSAVYWATKPGLDLQGGTTSDGELWQKRPESPPQLLASGLNGVEHLREHRDHVYWSEQIGWRILRAAKTGGAPQFLYAFEGCHNFGFAEERLIVVWKAGIHFGWLDGTQPLRHVADTAMSGRWVSNGGGVRCDQVPVVVGDELFHRRDGALVATQLQTQSTRLLLPDFDRLLAAEPGYVDELKLTRRGETSSWQFIKRDLTTGEVLRSRGNQYELDAAFELALLDGYGFLFARSFGDAPWFTAFRFPASAPNTPGISELPRTLVPIDFRAGERPLEVTAHAVTPHGLYFAASVGTGSVLYRVPLPAP